MKTLYFTATGNSLYAAKRIGGELYSIPKLMEEGKFEFEDDAIGIVFPCYAWVMPRMVAEFLKKARFKSDYIFAVMTYGKLSGGALDYLAKEAAKSGIKFNYINELMMVDNYLPMFDMEDELKHAGEKGIEAHLSEIAGDIGARKNKVVKKGLGLLIGSLLGKRFLYDNLVDGADRKFTVTDACNACKVCEQVCPKDNIKVQQKPVYLHKCDACFACIHLCPSKAIHLKKEKNSARFLNSGVKLPDIIEANS
jgi:ferredoxin